MSTADKGEYAERVRRRQFISWMWLPGWLVDPRRRCPHLHQRGIYGDEIIAAGFRRARCLDCGRLLPDLPPCGESPMTWPGYDAWKARQYERDAEAARRAASRERVLCAHADRNGEGAHWRYADEPCTAENGGGGKAVTSDNDRSMGETVQRPTRKAYLSDLYEDDPAFKAVVDAISLGGYADDDGVWHPGPTLRDAEKAIMVMGSLAAAGFTVAAIAAVAGTNNGGEAKP